MKYSLAGKSILIIDDFGAMRKALRDTLYTLEADSIYEADSGVNAINAMSKTSFDVVLCDYNLGEGKNGMQVLEEVRSRKLIGNHCVFIIISAEQATGMVLGVMDGKPDEYLAKPFTAQQLSIRLQSNFARKSYLAGIETEIQRGNLSKAIKICDSLLAHDDKKMHTYILKYRAELAMNSGDFETARNIYREVLANRPLPWAKLGLGILEYQQNNIESAVAVFEQLVKEFPMLLEAYDWLGKAYESLNKPDEVETILNQAVDLSPQSILRQKKLAATADYNGNLVLAEKAYKASLQLGKYSIHKSCDDFAGLAKLYTKTKANEQALKTLAAMRKEFTDHPEAELRAASIEVDLYKNMGNEELSMQAMQKVLGFSQHLKGKIPKDLELDIVKTCFLSNQPEKAKQILDGLIKTHIDDEVFLNNVRRMHSDIGMENHSEKLIQKTKQMVVSINNKAVALYKQGNYRDALDLLEQAMETMPENQTITLNMLKIIIHDLKAGDISANKLAHAKSLFKKAQQIGIEVHKLGPLKMQFAQLSNKL